MVEEPLAGGLVNEVVRVDATVRRRVGDHTAFVHALLRIWRGAGGPARRG